jgi:aryl-alcohol dehydrogenase-like predicted oxidoreductase
MSQVVLGTANFGNAYGVASAGQQLANEEIKNIIEWAQLNGINHFDTAAAYGPAELLLGEYLNKSTDLIIDSKLDLESCKTSAAIVDRTKKTLARLQVNQLAVLYLHDETLLSSKLGPEVIRGLQTILDLGLAKEIGVSVYSEEGIVNCKAVLPALSVFQVPENICDRRLISSRILQNMYENGNRFLIRSAFLQGLLLMEPQSIPRHLTAARETILQLKHLSEKYSISRTALCLSYAHSIRWSEGVVVGITTVNQLQEIVECNAILPAEWEKSIPVLTQELLDPRKWPL